MVHFLILILPFSSSHRKMLCQLQGLPNRPEHYYRESRLNFISKDSLVSILHQLWFREPRCLAICFSCGPPHERQFWSRRPYLCFFRSHFAFRFDPWLLRAFTFLWLTILLKLSFFPLEQRLKLLLFCFRSNFCESASSLFSRDVT